MKAVLVIDMPKDCPECPCFRAENDFPTYYGEYCSVIRKGLSGEKPEWCPLRPLPQKMTMEKALKMERVGAIKDIYTTWDACLDEIIGETE